MEKSTHIQLDRIEAKLDTLLDLEEIQLDTNGFPINLPTNEKETRQTTKRVTTKEQLE